jgi:hypothetical protein
MKRLSETEFQATFSAPMQLVRGEAPPPFDFWVYFDAIPPEDFEGHDCSAGTVSTVYRHPAGRLEHVLVDSEDRDVFMVLVLDRDAQQVVGHHLLDLPRLYGLLD